MSTPTISSCTNCGANNRSSASRCEFCHALLDSEHRTELVQKSLTVLLNSAEKQIKAGNRKIDMLYAASFGVPLLAMVASIMWGPGPWVGLALAFVLFFALVMLASSVETKEQQQMFDNDIRPKLLDFIDEHHISKKELLAQAHDSLSENSELREFIGRL